MANHSERQRNIIVAGENENVRSPSGAGRTGAPAEDRSVRDINARLEDLKREREALTAEARTIRDTLAGSQAVEPERRRQLRARKDEIGERTTAIASEAAALRGEKKRVRGEKAPG